MSTPGQLDMLAALEQVERGADEQWLMEAEAAIHALARRGQPFTTEDCKVLVTATTPEPRAWGAVIRKYAMAGLIRKTGQLVEARNRACHARPMTQWTGVPKEATSETSAA